MDFGLQNHVNHSLDLIPVMVLALVLTLRAQAAVWHNPPALRSLFTGSEGRSGVFSVGGGLVPLLREVREPLARPRSPSGPAGEGKGRQGRE